MAKLVEFSWYQSAMSYSDTFKFKIRTTEGEPNLPHLRCDYTDRSTGERIKLGEKAIGMQGFGMGIMRREGEDLADYLRKVIEYQRKAELQEAEAWPTVPIERWEELAECLRKAELRAYTPPPPGLRDATDSCISVTWREGGEEFTNRYGDGGDAHELRKLIEDIAGEARSQPQPAPAAPAGSWTCSCGTVNEGRFCTECGQPQPAPTAPAGSWTCFCGTVNEGKFCTECGAPMETHYKKFFTGMMDDREANQVAVSLFQTTRSFEGDRWRVLIDDTHGWFTVTTASDLTQVNPDILALSGVTDCVFDIDETHEEITREGEDGDPRRYNYFYDFSIKIQVNQPRFDEINFRINDNRVKVVYQEMLVMAPVPPDAPPCSGGGARVMRLVPVENEMRYYQYKEIGEGIRDALLQKPQAP